MSDENKIGSEVVNPIDEKVKALVTDKKSRLFQAELGDDKFKGLMQALGLYETDSNAAEVKSLQAKIDAAKGALIAAGFPADSPIVQGAIKGLTSELNKAQGKVRDNLPALGDYFGVKLPKTGARSIEKTGQLAMHRPDLAELKTHDYAFNQNDKKAIVVHSQTVAQKDLDTFKIKAESTTWVMFSYNGELAFTRNRSGDDSPRMIAQVTAIPENWLSVKPVTYTGNSLSGLVGVVAASLGLEYHGNGWQSWQELSTKFDKVGRVVKEA